jgi:hypothetical protein
LVPLLSTPPPALGSPLQLRGVVLGFEAVRVMESFTHTLLATYAGLCGKMNKVRKQQDVCGE